MVGSRNAIVTDKIAVDDPLSAEDEMSCEAALQGVTRALTKVPKEQP